MGILRRNKPSEGFLVANWQVRGAAHEEPQSTQNIMGTRAEATMTRVHNPKTDPVPDDNTEKSPDDWTTGDEPMTGAQASYLKTLSEQAHDPGAFADNLTKAEASKRIDALRERLKLQ
jgi:hypothetical protein